MPRPPPPNDALTSSGRPTWVTISSRSVSPVTSPPGSTGTPAFAISSLAPSLAPIAAIASGEGPTNVRPAAATSAANAAFSDRNP
jgi:hypothetical protein